MSKTIAILGATGNQGSGLIHALLSEPTTNNDKHPDPDPKIRALTRSTTSPAAQSLQKTYPDPARLDLVQADVCNADSLRAAFKDADAVFAMTNNRKSGGVIDTEDEMRHELVQGRNIIDAAKECKIPHLILSSLPNISRASHGRFTKVFHFDYKSQIEEWARRELPGVTVLHPGLYFSNMNWPQYCRNENGIVRFCAPVSGHQRADWVDPAYDIGRYAAGPHETTPKTYPVVSPKLLFSEFPRIFTHKTGIPAYFEPITLDEWGSTVAQAAGKGYETDIRQMMEWIAVAPDERVCYGTVEPEMAHRAWEELGVRASSFEEWLERTGWRGPGSG